MRQEYFIHRGEYSIWVSLHIYTNICMYLHASSCRWTHVSGEKWWNNADMVGKVWSVFKKKPKQHNFSYHKSHSHWLGIEQFPDIYHRSWSRSQYITILFLILLIPTPLAVIATTTIASLFPSANTNLRMWSCTAATVRCCHSTEGNTATICHLTYHRFLTTISSNKANTTTAEIIM